MASTSNQIIDLARLSGIPYTVGSTHRDGDRTASGQLSGHHYDQAVDFMGENQDELAKFFMAQPTTEVIHYSKATGTFYGWNGSAGRPMHTTGNEQLIQEHTNHLHVWMKPEQLGPGSVYDQLKRGVITAAQVIAGAGQKALGTILGNLGGVIKAPGNVTEALGNIGTAASNLATSTSRIADLVTALFLPGKLLRGGAFLLGTVFIFIGIGFLASEVKESSP